MVDGEEVQVREELYSLGIPMISVDYPQSKCEKQLQTLPDTETLKNFVFQECKAEANWNMKNFIADQVELSASRLETEKCFWLYPVE